MDRRQRAVTSTAQARDAARGEHTAERCEARTHRRGTAQASPMGLVECPELRGGSDTHAGGEASDGPTEERGADPEDPRKGEKAARGRVTKDGVSLCGRGPSTVSRVITPREGTRSPGGSGQRRTRPSSCSGAEGGQEVREERGSVGALAWTAGLPAHDEAAGWPRASPCSAWCLCPHQPNESTRGYPAL